MHCLGIGRCDHDDSAVAKVVIGILRGKCRVGLRRLPRLLKSPIQTGFVRLARRDGTTIHYRITRPEVLTVVEALHSAFCPK
jgi:hypothetical protein